MVKLHHPPSLLMLQGIAEKIGHLDVFLDQKRDIKADLYHPDTLFLFQLLCLLLLSFHKGILIPDIQKISFIESKVVIVWKNRVKDTFIWGENGDDFLLFFKGISKKILKENWTEPSFLCLEKGIICLSTYTQTLTHILSSFEKRILTLNFFSEKSLPIHDLFILISSLPSEQINALFLYIAQFLPEDLSVKNASGHTLHVVSFFESPTYDFIHLIEKLHLYVQLLEGDFPIVQSITQSHTKKFLKTTLNQPAIQQFVLVQLNGIIQNQISPRLKLYYIFTKYLEKIL